MILLSSVDFLKTKFFKKIFQKWNSLDPDQDQHSVCPDLGPNYLQKLYRRQQKSLLARKEPMLQIKSDLHLECTKTEDNKPRCSCFCCLLYKLAFVITGTWHNILTKE